MTNDLNGKKLLILGANAETIPLVECANKMGVLTIVTSNIPGDKAKAYAWKHYDIDGLDVPGLIVLAKEEEVDGVLVGVADVLVPVYCKVCDALGLPCYATEEIVSVFNYKDRFKACCEKYGIHGIPEFYLDDEIKEEDVDRIEFPVVVKPVDSHSGLGITICRNREELPGAVSLAERESKSGRFIVEKYMECDDVGIYYSFRDGECFLSSIYDRNTTSKQQGVSSVNLGSIYPSKHIDDYYKRMHANAKRMFRDIGIQNGVLLISAFYENGEFYVYDPGFRLQGEAPHLIIREVQGYDQREMLIRFALTGSEEKDELPEGDDPLLGGKCAATFWIPLQAGRIAKIVGLDKINEDKRIIANIQRLREGDDVDPSWMGTEKQIMTRLYFVCDSKEELAAAIKEYKECIRVLDDEGNDMIVDLLDPQIISEKTEYKKRVALVTGGSRGIGYEIAKKMLNQGYEVAILSRDYESIMSAAKRLGKGCRGYVCDISRTGEIENSIRQIVKDYGGIDVLVNNAGILDVSRIDTITEDEWDKVINVNLKGSFFMMQYALPHLEKGDNPRIINVSSNAGRMGGYENGLAYTASKGGIIALTYGTARRLASKGITVNCVAPGTIETDMVDDKYDSEAKKRLLERFPVGRMGKAEEVAEAVCYFASVNAAFTTGAVLDVNGGLFMG